MMTTLPYVYQTCSMETLRNMLSRSGSIDRIHQSQYRQMMYAHLEILTPTTRQLSTIHQDEAIKIRRMFP